MEERAYLRSEEASLTSSISHRDERACDNHPVLGFLEKRRDPLLGILTLIESELTAAPVGGEHALPVGENSHHLESVSKVKLLIRRRV